MPKYLKYCSLNVISSGNFDIGMHTSVDKGFKPGLYAVGVFLEQFWTFHLLPN